MRREIIILFLVFIISPSYAQDFNRTKMDSLFSIIESNQKGMGSVSIFKNSKEVYQKSIGFVDIRNGILANGKTKYRIGSISKTFTATIIMQLVEADMLTLGSKLAAYYPAIPNAEEITIEHLLRHRSGLYNFTNSPDYLQYMESPKNETELIDLFIKNGTVFQPDEKFEYSNTNYVLLSFIIEKIEKKSFSAVLDDRITTALSLTNTYYGGKINPDKNEAYSYQKLNSWEFATETDMSIPIGAGAIVSTPSDLNAFFSALFKGKLVSQESLNKMRKLVDGYGIGMFQIPFYDKSALGHNGGIDGFQANSAYFSEDDVAIAYTSNGVVMPLNDILIGVLSIYFDRAYNLPSFEPGIELKSEDLDQYLGVYSSQDLPLKLTITKQGNQLLAQATGQAAFQLEAFETHKFRFDGAGIKIYFLPETHQLTLKQGGGEYEFSKEE